MIALNAELAAHPNWTVITEKKEALPDHEDWAACPENWKNWIEMTLEKAPSILR